MLDSFEISDLERPNRRFLRFYIVYLHLVVLSIGTNRDRKAKERDAFLFAPTHPGRRLLRVAHSGDAARGRTGAASSESLPGICQENAG